MRTQRCGELVGELLQRVARVLANEHAAVHHGWRRQRPVIPGLEAGRNAAVNRFVALFNRLGYDLIAIPRGALVTVEAGDEGGGAL